MKYKTLFLFFVILFLLYVYTYSLIQWVKDLNQSAWRCLVKWMTAIVFLLLVTGCAAPSEYLKHAYLDTGHRQILFTVPLGTHFEPAEKRADESFFKKDDPCKYWKAGCPEKDDG